MFSLLVLSKFSEDYFSSRNLDLYKWWVFKAVQCINTLRQELGGTKAYKETSEEKKSVVNGHCNYLALKFSVCVKELQDRLVVPGPFAPKPFPPLVVSSPKTFPPWSFPPSRFAPTGCFALKSFRPHIL